MDAVCVYHIDCMKKKVPPFNIGNCIKSSRLKDTFWSVPRGSQSEGFLMFDSGLTFHPLQSVRSLRVT